MQLRLAIDNEMHPDDVITSAIFILHALRLEFSNVRYDNMTDDDTHSVLFDTPSPIPDTLPPFIEISY